MTTAEIVPLAPGRFHHSEAADDLAEGVTYLVSQARVQGASTDDVLDALVDVIAAIALEADRPPLILAANAAVTLVASVKAGLQEARSEATGKDREDAAQEAGSGEAATGTKGDQTAPEGGDAA